MSVVTPLANALTHSFTSTEFDECRVFQTTPWRLISAILGVVCLLLMATLGILIESVIKPFSKTGPTKGLQEDSDCCSCPEKWIGYQCSCYFISNQRKTWAESRNSCASQNSSLLWLKNRDELDFLKSKPRYYWIGLSYNETRGAWVWEDGSALSRDLFSISQLSNPKNCISYRQSGETLSEKCEAKNRYICQQQPI
ncbi:natural killer cells antigen CD94-like [Trichechus manatus latirostris]|uniref:Natural killer cells antigen CD94 n=1 Tax=Trichechus manatus latirostris TaxID=127582 RepID=A0A2Y9RXK8_TRIMA|nr:natural killer cells antigen CD94-like [Trichechus manatus latirostris]